MQAKLNSWRDSKFSVSTPWMDLDLLKSANKNRNQRGDFAGQEQQYLLHCITHVMDCECFTIDGRVFYREISICDLYKNEVETYHLYDDTFPNFSELNDKQRKCVIHQSSIHKLYYRTRKCFDAKLSVCDAIREIKSKLMSFNHVVIGYKGGDFERRLCRSFGCFGVNIEFLDCPKFEVLHNLIFEQQGKEKEKKCCGFHTRLRHSEDKFHCAQQEVILFSCFVLKNRKEDYTKLLYRYECC